MSQISPFSALVFVVVVVVIIIIIVIVAVVVIAFDIWLSSTIPGGGERERR